MTRTLARWILRNNEHWLTELGWPPTNVDFFCSAIPFCWGVLEQVVWWIIPRASKYCWSSVFWYSSPLSLWRTWIFALYWVSTILWNFWNSEIHFTLGFHHAHLCHPGTIINKRYKPTWPFQSSDFRWTPDIRMDKHKRTFTFIQLQWKWSMMTLCKFTNITLKTRHLNFCK